MHNVDRSTLETTEPTLAKKTWSSGAAWSIAGLTVALIAASEFAHLPPLVLPVVSASLVLAGFLTAAWVAFASKGRNEPVADRFAIPGLLLFFGFAAAMMADLDRVTQILALPR